MCRIAGIYNNGLSGEKLKSLVEEMCLLQAHGGPDGKGLYTNEEYHLVLGHRRLSLIDLSNAAAQPMKYNNNRFVITYNGELYNYLELKATLKSAGCVFQTESDTEVILAAFATWGTGAFEKFNGMFAFALLDQQSGELYLVRDGIGIKPLYYAETVQGLVFASEVRAFKQIDYLQEKNENWPVYFMAYGHLPEPVTTLKRVKPLPKGTYLHYNLKSKTSTITSFGNYSFLEKIDNRKDAIELTNELLKKSVERHLISDAPIGVFLSGGLDSSIIASLANQVHDKINTISIYFEDNRYSEKKYQDLLQTRLSCDHHQHLIEEQQFHEFLPEIIMAMDLPSCDGINTWFISKYAKENGLKAVLSGIGGDELFGGYPSFDRISMALKLQQMPNRILQASSFINSKRFRRLSYLSIEGAVGRYLFLRGQFIPAEIASYLNATEAEVWRILKEQPVSNDINYLTPKNQASWLETNLYMQNQLLRDADVFSMAHGVEIRVPFLDVDFVKLALKITSDVKYAGKLPKQLLIDTFKALLPSEIWSRPKMGFTFPFKEWLQNDQYSSVTSNKDFQKYHTKMKTGDMHWSKFFAVLLMENNNID